MPAGLKLTDILQSGFVAQKSLLTFDGLVQIDNTVSHIYSLIFLRLICAGPIHFIQLMATQSEMTKSKWLHLCRPDALVVELGTKSSYNSADYLIPIINT